jgi:hypothetical protein
MFGMLAEGVKTPMALSSELMPKMKDENRKSAVPFATFLGVAGYLEHL